MYQAHYINPIFQFQIRGWRLTLTDPEGVLPDVRIEKSWPRPIATVIALTDYANLIASQVMAMQDPPQELTETIVPTIDLPDGKEMTP